VLAKIPSFPNADGKFLQIATKPDVFNMLHMNVFLSIYFEYPDAKILYFFITAMIKQDVF
jgi:hypothetical protein